MAGILDRANGCPLPEGPDSSEASPARGEVHGRLWGPILRFFGADLVVGVGSHASVTLPLDEREGVDFFEAQHSNLQDVVDATQRIDLEYCGSSHRGGLAGPGGVRGEASGERFERLRAASGVGQGRTAGDIDGTQPDERRDRPHDFPHCSICFQDATEGEAWVRFPCRHGMHPACWDEYVQHAVDYQRGPRTCPTCRERLVSRSPFRSPFGALEGTVEEGAIFRGPPGPARVRHPRDGTDHGSSSAAAGSGAPHGGQEAGEADAEAGRDGDGVDDNRVVVLVLGATGGFVQALCAQLNARAIQAIVVAISSVPVGRGGVIDEEWAVTNAIRVWGSRSVKQAATVGPVGRQREARGSEASLFPVQLIGAVFISAQPTRSEGGAAVFVGFSARRGLVRVTAQEHAYGRLHNRLFDLGRTARGRGASITWTVQRLRPRRDDGLGEAPCASAGVLRRRRSRASATETEWWTDFLGTTTLPTAMARFGSSWRLRRAHPPRGSTRPQAAGRRPRPSRSPAV